MASKFGGYEDQEIFAEVYDLTYTYRKDIDFFVEYSNRVKGRTLELGCGTGRILIPIALSGCEITGLDFSSHMLRKCQEKLSEKTTQVQERVRLIQGSMTNFETGEMYALVTTAFRSFQHLISVEEQKDCLYYISKHLFRHGLLILDLNHIIGPWIHDPKYILEREFVADSKLPDGRSLRCTTRTSAFHRVEQYNDIEIIYYITGLNGETERLVQAFPLRYFFRYEVEHLLHICGFRILEIFGDYDRSKYLHNSPEMIFIAEKE